MAALKGLLSRFNLPGPLQKISDQLGHHGNFQKVSEDELFVKTTPEVDGEECTHDCNTCAVKLPAKWSIEENDYLYGHIKPFDRHIVVATGNSDWIRDVGDIKGSVMEAIKDNSSKVNHGRLMLSASNMPVEDSSKSRCLLLPAFVFIENVTPKDVPELITSVINPTSTNDMPIKPTSDPGEISLLGAQNITVRNCPHDYVILLCSHKTRDARCGQSAPLIRKELERHLRPLGLLRDLHDDRPGGVGIYFISHVGGHKYSANMMIYRRAGLTGTEVPVQAAEKEEEAATVSHEVNGANGENGVNGANKVNGEHGAANGLENGDQKREKEEKKEFTEVGQCIWLARVKPADCENIVRYTVLQGKVVKPQHQLRGGFDRCKQLSSW